MTTFPYEIETGDWKAEAIDQLEFHWGFQLRKRLEGLTDEEYLWEPVPGAWSIRPRGAAASKMATGPGAFVMDFEFPEPDPAPVTTIAWRLAHITCGCFGHRTANHFGDRYPAIAKRFSGNWWETYDFPGTAAEAIANLDEVHDAWVEGIKSMSDAEFWEKVGPAEGPYADHTYVSLVLHINREVIHHGAEIALLRDLYRARS